MSIYTPAFPIAPGFGNLPNATAIPQLWETAFIKYFVPSCVSTEAFNARYGQQLLNIGDTINIPKQPVISINDYQLGQNLIAQSINDAMVQLKVTKGGYYYFKMETVQSAMVAADWTATCIESAGTQMAQKKDKEILSYAVANATNIAIAGSNGGPNLGLGNDTYPLTIGFGGNSYTPLNLLAYCERILDENAVPPDQRFFIATPAFFQQLKDENSKFTFAQVMGDKISAIKAYKSPYIEPVNGFMLYKSINLPTTATNGYQTFLFGHKEALATVDKLVLNESDKISGEGGFGIYHKGLMVWARQIIRSEAIFSGCVQTYGAV